MFAPNLCRCRFHYSTSGTWNTRGVFQFFTAQQQHLHFRPRFSPRLNCSSSQSVSTGGGDSNWGRERVSFNFAWQVLSAQHMLPGKSNTKKERKGKHARMSDEIAFCRNAKCFFFFPTSANSCKEEFTFFSPSLIRSFGPFEFATSNRMQMSLSSHHSRTLHLAALMKFASI